MSMIIFNGEFTVKCVCVCARMCVRACVCVRAYVCGFLLELWGRCTASTHSTFGRDCSWRIQLESKPYCSLHPPTQLLRLAVQTLRPCQIAGNKPGSLGCKSNILNTALWWIPWIKALYVVGKRNPAASPHSSPLTLLQREKYHIVTVQS